MSPSNRMTSRRRRKKKKKTKFSAARPGNETKKIEFHKKNKKKKKKKRREPTINDQQAKSQSPKSSTYHLPHWPQSPQSPDRNVFFLFLDFFIKKNFATHFFFVVVGGWWLRWWWCSIVCLFVFFFGWCFDGRLTFSHRTKAEKNKRRRPFSLRRFCWRRCRTTIDGKRRRPRPISAIQRPPIKSDVEIEPNQQQKNIPIESIRSTPTDRSFTTKHSTTQPELPIGR